MATDAGPKADHVRRATLAGCERWLANRPREARKLWAESIAFGERIGARPELSRTLLMMADHLAPSETFAGLTVRDHRARALETFESLGLARDLAAAAARLTGSSA